MKKVLVSLLAAVMLCTMAVSAADIPVYIDGEQIEFDVQPQMINGIAMVPMRFIFEKLGATVMYDEETETISAYRTGEKGEGIIILIQINNPKAFVNSETFELISPPVEIDGRTLVPVCFVDKALCCTVDCNEQEVNITTKAVAAETQTTDENKDKEE